MTKRGGGVHTTPNKDGNGWVNQVDGQVISTHHTKEKAVERGREEAKARQTEHTVHKTDGTIGEKNSYGPDSNPPKDKR